MAAAGQSAQAPDTGLEQRVVGLPTAIGTTFSLIVASSVLATVAGGFFASWVWLIALAIGFITMIFAAMSFSELATMIPKAGSMNEYVRAGLGPFFATITVGVGYIAVQLFPGTAENFVSAFITADILGAPGDYKFWAVVYMVFIAVINLLGIRPFAAVEVFLTFVVAGLAARRRHRRAGRGRGHRSDRQRAAGHRPHVEPPLGAARPRHLHLRRRRVHLPARRGAEAPVAGHPGRASSSGSALIAVPVVLYGLAAARYVPPDVLGTLAPTIPVDVGVAIFGDAGKWWMGIIVILASIGTLNAVVAGVPRILYGMALTRQLPSPFAWLIPATRAPWVGIVVIAAIPAAMNLVGHAEGADFIQLILAGVLGWVTAYVIIHVSVIMLRRREPDAERPYRSPLVPIPQILGIGLLGLAAYKIAPPGIEASSIYWRWFIFLLIAAAFSLVYNLYTYKSLDAIMRPVPLAEV